VRAPITGTIETRQVQTGQYLQAGAVLATLVRRDPLLLRFNVTEQDAQHLRVGMIARFHVRSDERDYKAKISHVGAAADPQSRMVAVTALVGGEEPPGESGGQAGRAEGPRALAPAEAPLRPGAFAEVAVPVGSRADAAVIPQQSVRPSEKGLLAFVVDGDVARERIVKLGMRTPDGKVEVLDGLKPGDQLVVRGSEALRDGAPVAVAGATNDAGAAGR
jgi:multidrug efflux pump subunit AcrA (membrane-fusion protein)